MGAIASVAALQSTGSQSKDPILVVPASQTVQPAGATSSNASAGAQLTGKALYTAALDAWRAPRPKDACMSCHGPDFLDLARIGSTDVDIVRRSIADGASEQEAQTLLQAIKEMRTAWKIPTTNARSFRFLQPGGALLPGNTSAERDLALAGDLAKVLPTLMSQTAIRTPAQARKARDEVLAFDWNKVRIGIPFPLWSADREQGAAEGTLNDWVADLPRVPKAGRRADWIKIQDEYLADPSLLNFWRLYFAVDELTQSFVTGTAPVDPADEPKLRRFAELKFKSALIGQHIMRTQLRGQLGAFLRRQPAFAYLATDAPFATLTAGKFASFESGPKLPKHLPNPFWEVGEAARTGLLASAKSSGQPGNNGNTALIKDTLKLLGAPDFVIDSVDPSRLRSEEEMDIRLSWFMAGMILDQGLGRTGPSNATKSGEYLLAGLWQRDYFLHRALVSTVRTVTLRYAPNASLEAVPVFTLGLRYFDAYNRHRPNQWSMKANQGLSMAVRNAQLDAFKTFTANMYRMNLHLHEIDLEAGRITKAADKSVVGDYQRILEFFDYAKLPDASADQALVRRVAAKAGVVI